MTEESMPTRAGHRAEPESDDVDLSIFGQEDIDALLPDTIELPDGKIVLIEAIIAAYSDGHEAVEAVQGDLVPIVEVIDFIAKEFGKIGTTGDEILEESLLGAEGNQASFRDGTVFSMLSSILENGRVGLSTEELSGSLRSSRRSKEKPVSEESEDDLQEILVDGPPDANDDVIRPPTHGPVSEDFIERLRNDKNHPIFQEEQASGNFLDNDVAGPNGPNRIVSVTYKGVEYTPEGSQIVIEEPGVWRLTINVVGTPGAPGSLYGLYYFEQLGAYDHSGMPGGDAEFTLSYTIEDDAGKTDSAKISFVIRDSEPEAIDDYVFTSPNSISEGNVLKNDSYGADGPGGILQISSGEETLKLGDADDEGRVTLAGAYGDLVFDFDDGSFFYYASADAIQDDAQSVMDEFFYTIVDGDGDEDVGNLAIEIFREEDQDDIAPPPDPKQRTEGEIYSWVSLSDVDSDGDNSVDGTSVFKMFMPEIDRLDIDGLLTDLGFEDVQAAKTANVFRIIETAGGGDLQLDIGSGWETFASVTSSPIALTLDEIESAIIDWAAK